MINYFFFQCQLKLGEMEKSVFSPNLLNRKLNHITASREARIIDKTTKGVYRIQQNIKTKIKLEKHEFITKS